MTNQCVILFIWEDSIIGFYGVYPKEDGQGIVHDINRAIHFDSEEEAQRVIDRFDDQYLDGHTTDIADAMWFETNLV